jgi:phenylacetate-CoA ligase
MSLTHQLFLQSLREIEAYAPDASDRYAAPLAANLLTHAYEQVPAYRERLGPLFARGAFDLLDWERIPLLRAAAMARLGAALEARSVPQVAREIEDAAPHPLVPIRRRSALSRIAAECERERAYERHGLDLAAPLAILYPDHDGAARSGRGWSLTIPSSPWSVGDIAAPPLEQIAGIAADGARILRTTAAIAGRLAQACLDSGQDLTLEAIVIADRALPPETLAEIRRVTSARIVHLIEWPVLGILAVNDPDRAGYLLPGATVIAEAVDADGHAVGPGGEGELVVTPLYEYATPLLRFATGLSVVAPDRSETRLGLRRLAELRGLISA